MKLILKQDDISAFTQMVPPKNYRGLSSYYDKDYDFKMEVTYVKFKSYCDLITIGRVERSVDNYLRAENLLFYSLEIEDDEWKMGVFPNIYSQEPVAKTENAKNTAASNKENVIKALKSDNFNSIDLLLLTFDFALLESKTHSNKSISKEYSRKIKLKGIDLILGVVTYTNYSYRDNSYETMNVKLNYNGINNEFITNHDINGDEDSIYNSLKLILQTID